jgi:hypothetical protein
MPSGLAQALGPVLQQIADMTLKIKQYDRQIQQLGQAEYPETQALLKVHGVGHLTALTFVLTLGSKERFGRSRDVGCYLGLRPRRSQSGDHDPQLGITHAGNAYLRSLLIECSNHSVPFVFRVATPDHVSSVVVEPTHSTRRNYPEAQRASKRCVRLSAIAVEWRSRPISTFSSRAA